MKDYKELSTAISNYIAYGEGLYAFYEHNKWGYKAVDSNKIIIPCQYDAVSGFSDGLAAVCLNDKWGYINHINEVIIPFVYDDATEFHNCLAIVSGGKREHTIEIKKHISDISIREIQEIREDFPSNFLTNNDILFENIIKDCGFASFIKSSVRYIHSIEPVLHFGNNIVHISGSSSCEPCEIKLKLFIHDPDTFPKDRVSMCIKNKNVVLSTELTFDLFNEGDSIRPIYKGELLVSLNELKAITESNCELIFSGGIEKVFSINLPAKKFLMIKYFLTPDSFSENDIDALLTSIFPIQMDKLKEKEECARNKQRQEDARTEEVERCIDKLRQINFYSLDEVYNLISTPKEIKAYERLLKLTKEDPKPHPIVKLLTKVPNKNQILNDLSTVRTNREFKENHKLISSVFKKKVELDDDTQKFINKLKRALES